LNIAQFFYIVDVSHFNYNTVNMPNIIRHGTAHNMSAFRFAHPTDLTRWTSEGYQVRFGQVALLPISNHDSSFQTSAWGISACLCNLLAVYTDEERAEAGQWLALQQNDAIALMLDDLDFLSRISHKQSQLIEDFFFPVDSELFLPRGLRMDVICVTNIVPDPDSGEGLEKFVAVLDHSEVEQYISERRGIGMPTRNSVH
jgi:hypothetical protein